MTMIHLESVLKEIDALRVVRIPPDGTIDLVSLGAVRAILERAAAEPHHNPDCPIGIPHCQQCIDERNRTAPSRDAGLEDGVFAELFRAVAKFPTWPTDPLHALAVLGEEFGELTKAMLQFTYEPHKTSLDEIHTEAIQMAAMALRLIASLDKYQYQPSKQHSQALSAHADTLRGERG